MFRPFAVVTMLFMTTDVQLYRTLSHKMDSIRVSSEKLGINLQEILSLSDNLPSVRLTNFKNIYYYGSIKIGTPHQKFKVIFDADSVDFWIFSKKCIDPICCNSSASKHNLYDSTRSKTYNDIGNNKNRYYSNSYSSYIKYFYVEGNVAIDTVNIANLNIKNQTFLEAIYIIDNIDTIEHMCAVPIFDGIFGLRSRNTYDRLKPPFEIMFKQGLVSSRIFSFYFNRDTSADLGGKLIFGGSDPAFYEGDFTYVSVINKENWELILNGIQINDFTLCEESCRATVDTSAWQITGPQLDILNIYDFTETNPQGIVDCDRIFQLPTIRFILDGKTFNLTGKDYIIRRPDNESICITIFYKQGTVENKKWVLGIPFIGRYYTEFDMEKDRVGFALAINSSKRIENISLSPFIDRNYTELDIEEDRVGFASAKNSSKHIENISLSPLIDRNYTEVDIEEDRVEFASAKNSTKHIENISLSPFIHRNYTEFDIEEDRVGFALAKNSSKRIENISLSSFIDRNYTEFDIEENRVGSALEKNSSKCIGNLSLTPFIVYFIMKFLNYWFCF